jgi:hypothetical protein
VPLKALEPPAHTTPADTERTGNLDFAEAAAASQHYLRSPSNLDACPARQDIKTPLHFIAEWADGLTAPLPVCLGKWQSA